MVRFIQFSLTNKKLMKIINEEAPDGIGHFFMNNSNSNFFFVT